jgi:thiamine pyrophosphokinase
MFLTKRCFAAANGTLSFGGMVSTSNEFVDSSVTVSTPVPLLLTLDTRER